MSETSFGVYERKRSENPTDKRLLILLHGYGSNEQDLPGLAEELSGDFNYLSLRAPLELPWGGYAWFPIYPNENGGFTTDIDAAKLIVKQLEISLEEIQSKYLAEGEKLWLLGFSQGSILSQVLMVKRPDLIAGVIGLSGYLNEELIEIDKNNPPTSHLFLAHGTQDEVINISKARRTTKFYHNHEVAHEYHEFDMGHSVSQEELEVLNKWWTRLA